MSAARRSLLTATAAGTLLGALWFVPSANATQNASAQQSSTGTSQTSQTSATSRSADAALGASSATDTAQTSAGSADGDGTRLADTGSVDTTPYVIGGTLFLGLGAGFVAYSVRRERTAAY
ncbi:hypothetical protein ACFV6E_11640 [Streptomyces sp. NPDC059785]|uniref:hypothetical protein n=1 Tax=unclassified Streptomyces TaxID=2593676 RepID=UPI00365FE161